MTTSDVWSIARSVALRSNDALATTTGAVPIGFSLKNDRYGLTQYSYSPSGELTMATYADGRKVHPPCWNIEGIPCLYALYSLINSSCRRDGRRSLVLLRSLPCKKV